MSIDITDYLIAYSNPNNVETDGDILDYQMVEGPDYIPGFTNHPARSFTYIQGFVPIEDEIEIAQFKATPFPLQVKDDPVVAISSFTPFSFRSSMVRMDLVRSS